MARPPNRQHSLWMGDLEQWMDEDFVTQAFATMGETVSVKIIRNRQTGLPAGYCFVQFSSENEALKGMLRLNGKIVPGSKPPTRFKLNQASFGREHLKDQEYSLFIGELSEEVDDYALYSAFHKKYISIKAAKVVIDSSGHSRGFGFIRFADENEQRRALTEMNNYTGLGQKPIRVSSATPKKPGGYSSGTGTATGTSTYYQNQQYQQNYPGYYDYNNWWQSYQTPDYYGYGQNYSQTPATTQAQGTSTATQSQPAGAGTVEEELEDPKLDIDVDKANEEFMERSEELYTALDNSRWHPLDNVMSTIDVA